MEIFVWTGEVPEGRRGMLELEVLMPPKTTTPKMQHRAGELRQNQTEAEAKLWSRLRAHRMGVLNFEGNMPLISTSLTSVRLAENWSLNWTEVNTSIKLTMMWKEPNTWKQRGTGSCGFGITRL
jgi:hypothetical protein